MRTTLLCLVAILLCSAAAPADAAEPLGYRGDGSCIADGKPPVTWSEKENVKWRTPLANWGYSSPVVVNGRVFLTTEPGWKQDFPTLNCFDAATGKLLWQREVNQLPATGLTEEKQAESLRQYQDILAKWRTSYQLLYDWQTGQDKDKALKKMAAMGLQFDPKSFNASYGVLRRAKFPWKEFCFRKAGFQSETWQHGCGYSISCVGQSFPTPVTDGQSIYVATAFMGFACYDFDGNLKWLRFSPGSYGGKWGVDYCKFARSPLLYGDLLISDMADVVRAFDKKTGQTRWSHDLTGGKCTSMVLPAIITCGDTDILLSKNRAYRLPDGKELTVEGWRLQGITRLAKHDERNVVFFTGGGEHGNWENKGKSETPPPVAARFTLEGDTLKVKVLWSGIDGRAVGGHTGIVYHDGKLHHPSGRILEALTGKTLAGGRSRRDRATPGTRHLLWIANGHVYGVDSDRPREGAPRGRCEVYTLDGKKVAENFLPVAPVEGEKAPQIIQQTGYPSWTFSYSCPFTIAGDRIYIRSNDDLWCIGK